MDKCSSIILCKSVDLTGGLPTLVGVTRKVLAESYPAMYGLAVFAEAALSPGERRITWLIRESSGEVLAGGSGIVDVPEVLETVAVTQRLEVLLPREGFYSADLVIDGATIGSRDFVAATRPRDTKVNRAGTKT